MAIFADSSADESEADSSADESEASEGEENVETQSSSFQF